MKLFSLVIFLSAGAIAHSQSVSSSVPKQIDKSGKFLFYLHGGVVTRYGNNAINSAAPEWGPYEYLNILDSLRKRGFNVISENRKENIDDTVYAQKIIKQVDTLLNAGIQPSNIILVGASAGWSIVLHVSSRLRNPAIKYVIMGGCWPDTHKEYTSLKLYGHFLSVYESSDPHGTCIKVFEGRQEISSSKEVKLNTGLSHGFIYKGHKEWIDPIVKWFEKKH